MKYFKAIMQSKHNSTRNLLTLVEDSIKDRFLDYLGKARHLTLYDIDDSEYVDETKAALLSCYSPTKPLSQLKFEILNKQKAHIRHVCQYCTINAPNTFDHYLPQELFSEFAAFSYNMLPCCGECNSKKSTLWKSEINREFIHLYFDCLPEMQYLKCTVNYEDGIPYASYTLNRPTEMPDQDFILIENHYRNLELLTRFSRRSNNAITSIIISCQSIKHEGKLKLKNELIIYAESTRKEFGYNYWQASLFVALSESDEFIESVIQYNI